MTAAGAVVWTKTLPGQPFLIYAAANDGASGLIYELRQSDNTILLQHVSASGALVWSVPLSRFLAAMNFVTDGAGGVFVLGWSGGWDQVALQRFRRDGKRFGAPPTIVVPVPGPRVDSTSAAGVAVTYVVTSPDAVGPIACTPASGSMFPLGQTTVTCSATNAFGVVGNASFVVTVVPTVAVVTELQNALSTATARIADVTSQLATANQTVVADESSLASLRAQLATANQALAARDATIAQLQQEIAQLQAQVAAQTQVTTTMTTAVDSTVAAVTAPLKQAFNDPTFTIPGATPAQQLANLADAVARLNKGRLQGVYDNLRMLR